MYCNVRNESCEYFHDVMTHFEPKYAENSLNNTIFELEHRKWIGRKFQGQEPA